MEFIINICNKIFTSLGLALGLISDDVDNANFRVVGVIFDPPKGSTVMVGQPIEATVTYTSDLIDRESIQLWVQPNDEHLSGSYQPSYLEQSSGRLTRHFSIHEEGILKNICIHAVHMSGEELYFENREVNYTIVANPEHEKIRGDGMGSKLTKVRLLVDDFEIVAENPKVKVGSNIDIEISYINTSKNGVKIFALPEAKRDFRGGYDPSEVVLKNTGKIKKSIYIKEPIIIDAVYVAMHNSIDELLSEVWIDKKIEFY